MLTKEIVVAKYKEDTSWANVLWFPTYIYDKSPDDNPVITSENINHIPVTDNPHYGREAHTYLLYIIDRYETLPDIIYFLQGSPFVHYPFVYQALNLCHPETVALSYYNPCHPCAHESGDRTAIDYSVPVPSAMGIKHIDSNMEGILRYSLSSRWKKVFSKAPKPEYVVFSAGAQFAVPKYRITQRPKDFYKFLLHQMTRPPFELDAWVMEMLWLYVFGDSHLESYPHRLAFRTQKMMA